MLGAVFIMVSTIVMDIKDSRSRKKKQKPIRWSKMDNSFEYALEEIAELTSAIQRVRVLIEEYRDDLNDRNFPSTKAAFKCIADELESALGRTKK